MENLKQLLTSQLLALVTANMAAQASVLKGSPELAACQKNLKAIQLEIFIRYNAG